MYTYTDEEEEDEEFSEAVNTRLASENLHGRRRAQLV